MLLCRVVGGGGIGSFFFSLNLSCMQTYDITSFSFLFKSLPFLFSFSSFFPLSLWFIGLLHWSVCECVWGWGGGRGRVPGWLPIRTCEMRHGVESIHNHTHLQSLYNNSVIKRDKIYRWRKRQQSISSQQLIYSGPAPFWNLLPSELRLPVSPSVFKKRLTLHMFS